MYVYIIKVYYNIIIIKRITQFLSTSKVHSRSLLPGSTLD